jgi:hypothetical protein
MLLSGDKVSTTGNQGTICQSAVEDLRKWRTIQLSSLLPLTLCVVFMFLPQEASGLGAIVLFLLVAFGIVFTEMKSDIALNRLIVTKEQTGISAELRQLLRGELRHLLKDPAIRDLVNENTVSSEEQTTG